MGTGGFGRWLRDRGIDGLHVLAAGLDGDLPGHRLGRLRHAQRQHALLEVRLDGVGVDAAGHCHRAAELTARHAAQPVATAALLTLDTLAELLGGRITATSDFVAPSGKPFGLDRGAVRLTLVDGTGGAVEYQGCGPA